MHPLSRAILLVIAALTLSAPRADAATFIVNATLDTDDGTCTAAPGGCTLREAMAATVAAPGLDTIAFDPAVFPPGDPELITTMDAPGSGSVIQECTAHGNDGPAGGAGIRVAAGSTGNVLSKNAAQMNDGPNLADGNANCDNNLWKDNFAVSNASCLD